MSSQSNSPQNSLLPTRPCQAADLYLHPTLADAFPNAALEALACGTLAVASAVGGIPEKVVEGWMWLLVSVVTRRRSPG